MGVDAKSLRERFAIPPDASNAADFLVEALEGYDSDAEPLEQIQHGAPPLPYVSSDRTEPGSPYSAAQIDAGAAYLARHQHRISKIVEAFTLGSYAAPIPDSSEEIDFDDQFRRWEAVRTGAKIMALHALIDTARGEQEAALRIIERMTGLQAVRELFMMGHLVRLASIVQLSDVVQDLLGTADWSEEQLARLQRTLRAFRLHEMQSADVVDAVVSEVYFLRLSLDAPLSDEETDDDQPAWYLRPGIWFIDLLVAYKKRMYLTALEQARIVVSADPARHYEIENPLSSRIPDAEERPFLEERLRGLAGAEGYVQSIVGAKAGELAVLQTLEIAIAVERFRLANGRIPESLESLMPVFVEDLPVDPWSGTPPKLRIVGDSYTIYYVGPGGEDHGGYDFEQHKRTSWGCGVAVVRRPLPAPSSE